MKHKPDKSPRPPASEDSLAADAWADQVNQQAAKAMARWLKDSLNVQRPIVSLSLTEMKNLAQCAIHTWIIEASRRRPTLEKMSEEKIRIDSLLS